MPKALNIHSYSMNSVSPPAEPLYPVLPHATDNPAQSSPLVHRETNFGKSKVPNPDEAAVNLQYHLIW